MKRIKEIINELKSGEIPRICLISTDDKGLLTFLIERFKTAISSKHGNMEIIGYESPFLAIDSARSFSLLSKPRLLISEIKTKEIEILKKKLELAGNTYLIFSSDFIPQKELSDIKNLAIFNLKELYEIEIREIIEEIISLSGYKITEEALNLLLSFYSGNFGEILNECEKLMNYVGERRNIEQKDVLEAIVGTSREINPGEVFQVLMNGDKKIFKLTTYLKEQAKKNENLWVLLIGYINSKMRTLLELKERLKTEKLKTDPFLLTLARTLKYQKIYEIFDILREYDIPIKYGYIPRHILFDRLVLSIFLTLGYI